MTARRQSRGRGEGTISLRKDGRYQIRVKDPITGHRRTAYAKTLAEARRKCREMVARKDAGETVLDTSITVKQYAMAWLADEASRSRASSTVREYKRRLETYVLPRIGHIPLKALSVPQVEQVLQAMADEELSRSSIVGCRNALSAMLAEAVNARQLRDNVAVRARLPLTATQAPKGRVATVEQVQALLDAASGTDLRELLVLITFTGCRIGEALGAHWSDFDLEAGRWIVSRTTTLDGDGRVVVGARTKTGNPRTVYLRPPAVQALQAQRAKVAAARLRAGKHWRDQGLAFPTTVGTAQDSRNLRKQLEPVRTKANFPGSFHELRRFFATVASSKVTLTSLSKVLGHQRVATTADLYAHLYDPDATAAASAVAEVLDVGAEG